MAEQEEPLLQSGDTVKVIEGEYKGKKATVISAYTNSISVEFELKMDDGSKPRTVLRHSEYEIIK
ncbi:50S ribosomal protein L24 [Salipaludibacillus agaradhaerens]|jgi:ribosomal protein L24|uniref:50S ribosomal protein L24 n=1 Tax=Salipaludibacillus agaradhaerens TaxID=76935 RepID=A0A9Q4B0Z4_SALAG|nr:KOW motif domain-containing protein [Salipaludibacillus agaradhaerens]UJW57838.1 50S ribosomal protein L24 [Bacillus sp. A116_S68]MCR6096368.1 50S ribosomal protein L24 [Salipaludibacillus agaradhaerens]MCR6106726.1 50S ribosomal protein L24 [Salipaludibacillus agaradhaerens]MCR6114073.1 50S ribosomal protein L24 [Salipaludibacillus agaradhaerens]MCR6118759.1 50S ribosomal protein L24 [Salipaludibacillus agaradhaerens]